MTVGVCTCPQGIDGSPCSHQAAISIHYGTASINCIPTIAPSIRQIYAQIALGVKATTNLSFYVGLHDVNSSPSSVEMFHADFTSPSFDRIRAESRADNIDTDMSVSEMEDFRQRVQHTCLQIDKIADDLKKKVEVANEQLLFGVEKFTSRYEKLKGSIPLLTSSLHRFG